jgi:2C-methyl-D-erythritol 2,4-cyclodiphosphate synthase
MFLVSQSAIPKGYLRLLLGKVLIIDEAYMLAENSTVDAHQTAVIDTIVAEVQSTPGEIDAYYFLVTRTRWKKCSATQIQV